MGQSRTVLLHGRRLMGVGSALAVVLALASVPVILWHRVCGQIISAFHWSPSYLAVDLGPWLLVAAGVGSLLPVALSVGLDPESRFYPRARREYFTWGIVLYLLGIALVIELYNLWQSGL